MGERTDINTYLKLTFTNTQKNIYIYGHAQERSIGTYTPPTKTHTLTHRQLCTYRWKLLEWNKFSCLIPTKSLFPSPDQRL